VEIINTSIDDLVVIKPSVYLDERGYFFESFNIEKYKKIISEAEFMQDNESKSNYGVIRGLHFQKKPHEQSKLVRVIKGKVLDVAVDLRKGSKTFGKYESIILSDKNKKQLYIPRGFAHGFIVLSKEAIFAYKVDNFYAPSYDCGIKYNDPDLNIDWIVPSDKIIISEKDNQLQYLRELSFD